MHTVQRTTGASSGRHLSTIGMGFALLFVGAAGCASGNTTDPASVPEARALFKDPSSSGPRLDVYDVDGHAAIAVSGPIGSEERVAGLSGDESLAEIFRALHPDAAKMPSELGALDARIAPELAAIRAAARPAQEATPATFDKSQSAFNSTVCKNFPGSSSTYVYKPQQCDYRAVGGDVAGVGIQFGNPNTSLIQSGDRTYGWNNNASQASLTWFYIPPGGGVAPGGGISIPAYWWTWCSVTGGGPYFAYLASNNWQLADGGDKGLTWHKLFTIVR
jgi:hypothetical protein